MTRILCYGCTDTLFYLPTGLGELENIQRRFGLCPGCAQDKLRTRQNMARNAELRRRRTDYPRRWSRPWWRQLLKRLTDAS